MHTSLADQDPDPDPAIFVNDKSPYTFPGGVAKIVNKNAARVAEVPCHVVTDPDPDPAIFVSDNLPGRRRQDRQQE